VPTSTERIIRGKEEGDGGGERARESDIMPSEPVRVNGRGLNSISGVEGRRLRRKREQGLLRAADVGQLQIMDFPIGNDGNIDI